MKQQKPASRPITPALMGRTAGSKVPVYLVNGLIDQLGRILGPPGSSRTIEVVTDRHVATFASARVRDSLIAAGWSVNFSVMPAGEKIKSSATVSKLHNHWFELHYDRQTTVIALGGGTVGDVTGFAAATFMRGLPFWQVPTTIVAQVDAALGGKVGINHARGKNLIGCFFQPAGIVIDPSLLVTLPERERRSGLAEVVKYGVIADPVLFKLCERHMESWVSGASSIPVPVIARCARIKLRIVAIDETDHGLRRTLNFGHTLGHAFERWGKYRSLRHGEAVALGMVGAGWIAAQRGLWTSRDFEQLSRLCRILRPALLSSFKAEEIISHLKVDKKRAGGRNVWILPRSIGRVDVYDDVTDRDIKGALSYIAQWMSE